MREPFQGIRDIPQYAAACQSRLLDRFPRGSKTGEDLKSSKDEPLVQLSDIDMTRKPRQLLLTAG
jgi:hypothetical protein